MATSSILFAIMTVVGGLIIVLATLAMLLRHRKATQAPVDLVGRIASVEIVLAPEGAVLVGGELWRARSRTGAHIARGRRNVRIVGASAHLLEVEESGQKAEGRKQ